MTVVTADDADVHRVFPPEQGKWTVDDLARTPEDNIRRELFHGELIVSPSPIPLHQTATLEIGVLLRAACPRDMQVFIAPLDYEIAFDTSFQPDVVVMRRADVDVFVRPLRKPAVLVVEVLSTGSRTMDLKKKPPEYGRSGAEHYWTFDPLRAHFVARRWGGVEYANVAEASGDERIRLDEPYPVELCPAEIING
jgi:Uma2 family endonuclease